jgi:hypothetical protein
MQLAGTAAAFAIAALATAAPDAQLVAVPSFAVVTSAETSRRFFGPGLPAAYESYVPPIPDLVGRYLAAGQTLGFIGADELDRAAQQHSSAPTLGHHKVIVLPETAGLSDEAGAALLAFGRGGGSVVVVGSALAHGADGVAAPDGFATPLGQALQLRRTAAGPAVGSATIASRNVSTSSNPELWRLLRPTQGPLDGAVGAGLTLHAVEPLQATGGGGAVVLATATLAGGATLPLLTATRVGQRGWLVYVATTEDAQLVQQAVDFALSATGVTDPYNLNPQSPMGVKVSGGDPASTAILSYAPPSDPLLSLEGRFRVTLVGAAGNSTSTTCVSFLDRWWGDSPPSHTIVNTSGSQDFTGAITAQVSYGGAIACATVSPGRPAASPRQPPWFELRTTANGALHGFCKSPATKLAVECELNGRCSASGDCNCSSGWISHGR